MDNLLAIGVGLGLRALIDTVTHHNHRVNGSLVGLWEGAVLRHFITKYPSTLDPYIAYGFRLLADLLWTQSWMRLVIVVLWTFMGILLSDVGVDLSTDRRFRRLTRTVRYAVIYPLLRQFSSSRRSSSSSSSAGPTHAQFYQVPATTSTTSATRSPSTQGRSPTDISAPPRSATPGLPRRPALRVPGSFSDRTSETDTDATRPPPISRENSSTSQQDGSVTSRSSSSRTPSVTFSDPLVSQTRPLARGDTIRRVPSNPVAPSIALVLSPPPTVGSPPATVIRPPMTRVPRPILTTASAIPTSPPVRLRSPELEYVSVPAIPDNIEQALPRRPVLSDDERSLRSGLTTPRSDRSRPDAFLSSPPPVNSGLTTPDHPHSNLPHAATPIPHGTSSASSTVTGGTDATAAPLPIRLYAPEAESEHDAEQVQASLLHPGLLPDIPTPQPSPGVVQPVEYLPSPSPEDEKAPLPIRMPEPDLSASAGTGTGVSVGSAVGVGAGGSRMTMSEPPPAYEQTPGQAEDDGDSGNSSNTPAQSVISHAGDRTRLLQRAESFRSTADEVEKRRAQLKRELEEARRSRDHWAAFRLKHEVDRAEKETRELHAKAARRFYQAHNMKPEPQTIDVHRLKVTEAREKVEQALYDAIVTGVPQLRIITGRGNHSMGGIPRLKLAIIGAMEDYHIDVYTDPNNSGVLIINPPSNPKLNVAGPSTSS